MSRYIDADVLKETMMQIANNSSMKKYIIDTYIDTAPTADVKPIIYGKWEKKGLYMVCCSNCGHELNYEIGKTNFCPLCGADMRKESEEEGMNERNCENCKHHTENGCTSWECEYEPEDENTAK